MAQLGANAYGEVLEPGRVPDCYVGLLLRAGDPDQAPSVLVVSSAALLHPTIPQPDGTLLYELVTGHPDRTPCELVFLADLTVELRAWPADTWSKVGVEPQAAAGAVVASWQRGDLLGLRLGGLTAEEALALERPAMTLARAQLGDRLQRQVARAYRRWRHPSSGRRPGDRFRLPRTPAGAGSVPADTDRPDTDQPSGHRRRFRKQQPDSHGGRGVRVPQPRGHRPRCPAAGRLDGADPQPPLRRDGSAAHGAPARLRWSRGRVDAAGGGRLSGRADTGGGLPDSGRPHASALRTPATAAGACRHCGSGHAGQPGSRTVHHRSHVRPESDGHVQRRPAPRLTARSVAWCSASIWSAPDESGLLRLRASSIQTDPAGSCRIVWMSNGMIKAHSILHRMPQNQTARSVGWLIPDRPPGPAARHQAP